jgi:hypothetical protein
MTKTRISVEGRFVFEKNTSRDTLLGMLEEARRTGSIHDVARIIREGRRRHLSSMHLTVAERTMMIRALVKARYDHATGRSAWFPPGYRIVEALCITKDMMPDFHVCIHPRDVELMKKAIQAFKKKEDVWGDEVIEFVVSSAKQINVFLA